MKAFITVGYTQHFIMFIAATLVLRREITVGLDEWTPGWDGVGCMSQHEVGTGLRIMFAESGWGWEKFLKILHRWC